MDNKLHLLNQYHNNYWVRHKIGQALIDGGEIHSMVYTRLEGLKVVFQSIGQPYSTLAAAFFDTHLTMLRRGLVELGNQPGVVNVRAYYMATMEQQLILDIVRYSDEGIGIEQACLAMVNNLSNALMGVTPNRAVQGPTGIQIGNKATTK
jgi:hypothetical protein